jgi:ABC-type Mn2+/Zn2+ transport system ATPase subunit
MSEILRAEDISVGYDGKPVIRGLSFTLNDGDVVAVLGPNGSGKTTLVRAVLSLMPLRSGRIVLFGRQRLSPSETERLIGYIPQRPELDRTFPISLSEMLGLSAGREAIDRYLDMLDLRGLLAKKVGDLSGGQVQRALLAYAIIKGPRLLVMDEPTSWVDARGADCVLCLMEEFKTRGIAMMLVSHDFSVVEAVSTKVLGLGHEGHFFEDAKSPALKRKIASLFGTVHHGGGCRPEP